MTEMRDAFLTLKRQAPFPASCLKGLSVLWDSRQGDREENLRAILFIVAGCAIIAAGLRVFPDTNDIPTAMSVILVVFGLLVILAGLHHLWLRIQRRRAYAGGRDRKGEIIVEGLQGEEEDVAQIVFVTKTRKWRLTVDTRSLAKDHRTSGATASAKAWLGDDDLIYAIDVGDRKLLPISAGKEIALDDERTTLRG
ncbi:DUF308 domain-containing protein [Qipengyuania sphaerica]|uniref:DUF308 domain-containing protein n=1 Tax=Qipengyuania sphaerica TaxID=2867243 RepID=UPI001C86D4DE|nr:DUF308 domain-containing protein [Qipengyuania sphaerica]MBX7539802.1 DUF308 domain-containing protein [Qipengyuania sphaerica]